VRATSPSAPTATFVMSRCRAPMRSALTSWSRTGLQKRRRSRDLVDVAPWPPRVKPVCRTAIREARDSTPRFSLERVVSSSAVTRTYGVVATGGCHDDFECVMWWRRYPRSTAGGSVGPLVTRSWSQSRAHAGSVRSEQHERIERPIVRVRHELHPASLAVQEYDRALHIDHIEQVTREVSRLVPRPDDPTTPVTPP
jgi:hypothetical protein